MRFFYLLVGLLAQLSQSQVINSKTIPGATISYQKTTACNASSNVVSYSGYVRWSSAATPDIQGSTPFSISTFFWFFPARKSAGANLALYLAGGPGEASSFAALTENGPCYAQRDGNSVVPNPFSFNENAHVLYVDQPNQVGFSYDQIINGVFDALNVNSGSGAVIPGPNQQTSLTKINGRFPSQNLETTAKTSTMAAKSMWYFLQVFFADFGVNYGEKNSVSIWGNSGTTYRHIDVPSVGITNGCVDIEAQGAAYASFPYNNTYDNPDGTPFRIYSKEKYNEILAAANQPGGCFEQVQTCRKLKAAKDPGDEGRNAEVNLACGSATLTCNTDILLPYFEADGSRSQYDIGLPQVQPWPPKDAASYMNNPRIRDSLGVPPGLNYTLYSNAVFTNFFSVGDPVRKGSDDLTYLLNQGTRVALIYGDRDWRCNWIGAENLTLSLPWTPHPTSKARFSTSSYVPLSLPSTSSPTAVTRQHTLLSFSRVFQAGHAVSWYQPETVQTIFNRVVKDVDVATGQTSGGTTVTRGKRDSWSWRFTLRELRAPNECSLWYVGDSCSGAQGAALAGGTAAVDATWRVVAPAS